MADPSLNKKAELKKAWLAAARPAEALDPKFPYEDEFVANAICKTPMPFDAGRAANGFSAKFRARISFKGSL
jgi:hypothetical protein